MARLEKSVTINTPVGKVFSYITNPMNQLEYTPGMTEVRDIVGEGVGQRFRWTYKMMGIPLKGESEVTEYVASQRYVEKSKGGIDSTWTWTFKPEAQRTLLNLVVEYTIPIPVLGKIGERLVMRQNEREADVALAYVKDKLEG
jgi:ligand-binding SRPBCC domain-containing protein